MIVKIVTFFLIGMVILGMLGRLKLPGSKKLSSAKCPRCGKYKIGRGPCDCGKRG